jgi:hypothetical protein
MMRPTVIARPQRLHGSHRIRSPLAVRRAIIRNEGLSPIFRPASETDIAPPDFAFAPDPYLDYGRYLTDEGGILIIYKDHDLRFRQTLWRVFAWTLFTGLETLFLAPYAPLVDHWINTVALLACAALNYFIVNKPVEIYCRIEIRPDCMIIEGSDVFWSRYMEGGVPTFRPDAEGNQMLCGIYGTRFVEFLTVRRFGENDRMMEVFAAHLADAMQQQWSRPY